MLPLRLKSMNLAKNTMQPLSSTASELEDATIKISTPTASDLPVKSSQESIIADPTSKKLSPTKTKSRKNDDESRTIDQIIALGSDASVSKKVITDTLNQIEEIGKDPTCPGRTARVEIFYFTGRVMQTHTAQPLANQSSNPFKNPRHMAVIITRLIEIYLTVHPSIRFLIITYPMHHLPLMYALRDHIGADTFKIIAIAPSPPLTPRTSSLSPAIRNSQFAKPQVNKGSFSELSNTPFTSDLPVEEYGKLDFVLYTTSPMEIIERTPIRIDLLIDEIRECLQDNISASSPVKAPHPAIAWSPKPKSLPHPLADVARGRHPTSLPPLDIETAAKYQTAKIIARRSQEYRKQNPGAPPRPSAEVVADWEATFKEVYGSYQKIKLRRERHDSTMNPSDEEKEDDEYDYEGFDQLEHTVTNQTNTSSISPSTIERTSS